MTASPAEPRAQRIRAGDVVLEVLEWGPPPSEDAIALIAMHGAISTAGSWDDLGRAAAAGMIGGRSRTVAAVSRRGCGGSDTPTSGYAFLDFGADLVALIDALGYPRAALVAHSLGVPIAIAAAARTPGLAGLVLGDFGPRYPAYDDGWLARIEERERTGRLTDARIEAMRALRHASRSISLDDELRRIACPVLVVTGTASDVLLTATDRARYERGLRDVRVVTLEGAGHMLEVEGRPDAFHAAVGAFLASRER